MNEMEQEKEKTSPRFGVASDDKS